MILKLNYGVKQNARRNPIFLGEGPTKKNDQGVFLMDSFNVLID